MRMERGTLLYHQGYAANAVHVVVEGWVKVFRMGASGAETIIRVAGAGDVLGDEDLLAQQGYQTCAEAISVVRVVVLRGDALLSLMRKDPAVSLRVVASLSAQLRQLAAHVEELKLFDARERTAYFLLGLSRVRSGAYTVALPFEKTVIAAWLGMKPASLSRALARLRPYGVTVDRETILVADARRLQLLVQRRVG